jgi:fused signal recognition particle receptor
MEKRFDKWKQGLARTRKTTFGRIANLLGTSEIDAETWDDLEAMLVQADLGIETAETIIANLKEKVHA